MHHDSDGGKGDRRFRLKVRHFILAAFVLLLMAGILRLALLSSGANQRLEALRAAGQPTSLAELAMSNKLSMGMEMQNAAPVYREAFWSFVPPADPNTPYVGKRGRPLDRGAAVPEPVARAIEECLTANEKCLGLLHRVTGSRTCRYDYDYRKGFPHLAEVRSCAQLATLAAVYRASQGDAEGSVARFKDGLCLGDSLANEPFLMTGMIRLACAGLIVRGMERALSTTTFTDPQLKDLDDALADTAGTFDLARVIATERCLTIETIRDPSLMGPGMAVFPLKLPGVHSQGLIDALDYMGACVEAADLPDPERMARFRAAGAELDGLSVLHLVAKVMVPALVRVAEIDARARVHVDLARTALAVERYRLAQGNPPEKLTDLVPAYLSQVPLDPFDGQPIRYRRTMPGYVVYSVMEDGQGNGGKEREDVGKGEPHDLCFIVTR